MDTINDITVRTGCRRSQPLETAHQSSDGGRRSYVICRKEEHLGSCNLYADDTLIYCTRSNIVELKTNIQKCVTDVHEWYESNKLVINTSKSNVMLLTTRKMLSHMTDTDLNLHIGNHELLQCNNIKYLGVDIDNVLSWDIQTDSISKKLVFIISRLSRLKPVLPSHMLMYIYTSIIQP